MQLGKGLLRVAAATAVTLVTTVGAVGPVHAINDDGDSATMSEQSSAPKSDTSHGTRRAETGRDHTDGNASTEGDPDATQPESTADENDAGANAGDCEEGPEGPYCGTARTEPSRNGEGDGAAFGRPGAGTVGKADNKNPAGQLPGPRGDGDGGYECDDNRGIAEGNPAHTGCTEGTLEVAAAAETCPADATMGEQAQVAGAAQQCALAPGAGAPEEVAGVQAEVPASTRPAARVSPVAGALPATGAGEYAPLVLAGLALVAAGTVLMARRRPQRGR